MDGDVSRDEEPWPSFALPRGTVVNGYRIDRVLGSGGFGITYLALDLLQQSFAIKEYYPRQFAIRQDMTVRPTTAEDVALFDECRERFLREAQALVLLGRVAGARDGIVRVQTYFEAFGTCFLVMDYVEGPSLASVLREQPGGLPAGQVRSLLAQLLSSIRVVHRAGLLHRDIKPANIILRDSDRLVLIDFGAARRAAPSETATYTQIYSGGYGPPEQVLGLQQGEFSDLYAIGAVCYRAIGGRMVDALGRQNSLSAGRPDPQPPAATIGAGRYPRSLLATIDAALAVDPARRPRNVDAMLEILGANEPVGVPTVVAARRIEPPPPARARRGVWIAAAGVGALALAGAAYLVLRSPSAPAPAGPQQRTAVNVAPVAPPPVPEAKTPATGGAPAQSAAPLSPPQVPRADVPAPSPPPQEPQHEAIVAPAPAPPPPASAPPSPFERAQDAARSLPCAALHLAAGPDSTRISGFAPAGQDIDGLLAELRNAGRLVDDVTRVDRFACAAIATVAPMVRNTWEATPPVFGIQLDQPNVTSGAHLGISMATMLPALYVDIYQVDGTVHHLLHLARSGATGRRSAEWVATLPTGPRLVVAIGAVAPLDLGARPETEKAADYLVDLRARLADAPTPVAADLAMVIVRAAAPAVARLPQPRPNSLRSEKCANIVSRAQLGETLSDAELATLRTECRS